MRAGRVDAVRRLSGICVVVPAHDEEDLIGTCLSSLHAAAASCPVPVRIVVVADACTDRTAQIVNRVNPAGAATQSLITVAARNVGVARAAGFAEAMRTGAGADRLWITTTDADSTVPRDWLVRMADHARRGADLVLGTVRATDWADWSPALAAQYRRRYSRGVSSVGHGHIHGANLGVDAAAYRSVGGFQPLATGEDVELVRAVRAAGARVVTVLDLAVTTSTRGVARAPAGFSEHLHLLAAE